MTATLLTLLFPHGAHAAAPPCDPASSAVGLVINEFLADPEGSDPGLQWVELYNESGLDLNASGWMLQAGEATFDTSAVFPPGTELIDGEFVLIAQTAAIPGADLVLPDFTLGASIDADALRVVDCAGRPVDTVVYGAPNTDGWRDDTGAMATSLAEPAASGQPHARLSDGADTDQSADDFALTTTATPRSSNGLAPADCGGPESRVLVNEVFDDGQAWVELLHMGTLPVQLEGWSIEVGTTSWTPSYTFEAGQIASPGGRFVVGDADEALYPATLALTSASAVRLTDCLGFAADVVVMGSDNAMGWVDDAGTAATSFAPLPAPGESVSRLPDGADTDASAVDFALAAPTPVEVNGTTVDPPEDTGPADTDTDTPDPVDTAPPVEEDDDLPDPDEPEDASGGCGCDTTSWPSGAGLVVLGLLVARRRGQSADWCSPASR